MLNTNQDIGANLLDVFQSYKIPVNQTQDFLDPADGHIHRLQEQCLGISTIQIGANIYPNCTFFEITESEISDVSSSSSGPEEEESTPDSPTSPLDSLANFALTKGLPPKKRNRRRMVRYEVVFTMDAGVSKLSNEHTFYAFPREAVTECLTTVAPHKLVFSSFSSAINKGLNCGCDATSPTIMEEGSFKTKLEEFAAVCSNRCKLTLPDQTCMGNSIVISNASNELYQSFKQLVRAYEVLCQNVMNLIKSHNHEVTKHKWDMLLPEKVVSRQPENNTQDESWAKDTTAMQDQQPDQEPLTPLQKSVKKSSPKVKFNTTASLTRPSISSPLPVSNQVKKCLYCGSKSTPMWRRGPQGAGTLCNACGVKWKHGKILSGHSSEAIVSSNMVPDHLSTSKPKPDKKRKRLNSSSTVNQRRNSNKRKNSQQIEEYCHQGEFAIPAPKEILNQVPHAPWEGQSTTSSSTTSDSCSPLESFTSSPNNSAVLVSEQKRDMTSLFSYDTETLSVYVGEDAVEAAALLTLLKRS